jgi:hypothetical protein
MLITPPLAASVSGEKAKRWSLVTLKPGWYSEPKKDSEYSIFLRLLFEYSKENPVL